MTNLKAGDVAIRRSPLRPWPETLALISELYEFFAALDIPKLAASRLRTYKDAFNKFKHASESGTQLPRGEAEDVIQTMVEFEQLRIIVEAAKKSPQRAVWASQLRKLASGPVFGTEETTASSPRDTQFECFVAAVAARAGYNVAFAEPDIILNEGKLRFGVAAKRPRSLASVEKNCRKAARQIAATKLPGILALDLTHALHAGKCFTPATREEATNFAQSSIQSFLDENEKLLRRSIGNRAVAILAAVHVPAIIGIPAKPQLMTAVAWQFFNLSHQRSEYIWIAGFAKRCVTGLFGTPSSDEPSIVKNRLTAARD